MSGHRRRSLRIQGGLCFHSISTEEEADSVAKRKERKVRRRQDPFIDKKCVIDCSGTGGIQSPAEDLQSAMHEMILSSHQVTVRNATLKPDSNYQAGDLNAVNVGNVAEKENTNTQLVLLSANSCGHIKNEEIFLVSRNGLTRDSSLPSVRFSDLGALTNYWVAINLPPIQSLENIPCKYMAENLEEIVWEDGRNLLLSHSSLEPSLPSSPPHSPQCSDLLACCTTDNMPPEEASLSKACCHRAASPTLGDLHYNWVDHYLFSLIQSGGDFVIDSDLRAPLLELSKVISTSKVFTEYCDDCIDLCSKKPLKQVRFSCDEPTVGWDATQLELLIQSSFQKAAFIESFEQVVLSLNATLRNQIALALLAMSDYFTSRGVDEMGGIPKQLSVVAMLLHHHLANLKKEDSVLAPLDGLYIAPLPIYSLGATSLKRSLSISLHGLVRRLLRYLLDESPASRKQARFAVGLRASSAGLLFQTIPTLVPTLPQDHTSLNPLSFSPAALMTQALRQIRFIFEYGVAEEHETTLDRLHRTAAEVFSLGSAAERLAFSRNLLAAESARCFLFKILTLLNLLVQPVDPVEEEFSPFSAWLRVQQLSGLLLR